MVTPLDSAENPLRLGGAVDEGAGADESAADQAVQPLLEATQQTHESLQRNDADDGGPNAALVASTLARSPLVERD